MNFNGLIRTVDFFREVHVLCEDNEVYFQMSKLYLPTFLSYRHFENVSVNALMAQTFLPGMTNWSTRVRSKFLICRHYNHALLRRDTWQV